MKVKKSVGDPVFVTEIQHMPSHDNENNPLLATEVQVTLSEPQEVESGNERLISCPIFHSLFPSLILKGMLINVPCGYSMMRNSHVKFKKSYGGTSCDVAKTTTTVQELIGHQHKGALHGRISELSGQLLSQDTIRRKFIWQDFKAAIQTKTDPKSSLKAVFTREPAVDDGGPKK